MSETRRRSVAHPTTQQPMEMSPLVTSKTIDHRQTNATTTPNSRPVLTELSTCMSNMQVKSPLLAINNTNTATTGGGRKRRKQRSRGKTQQSGGGGEGVDQANTRGAAGGSHYTHWHPVLSRRKKLASPPHTHSFTHSFTPISSPNSP